MPTNLEHCPSDLFQNNNRGGYNVGDATKDEAGNDASKQYSMVSIGPVKQKKISLKLRFFSYPSV